MKKLVKYKGFTLSEVLVTLAVIGVVAALTIPALIQANEESKLRSGAKSAYSMLTNALSQIDEKGIILDFSASGTDDELRTAFCSQLDCLKTDAMNNIFVSYVLWYESSSGWDYSAETTPSAILNNGMILKFDNYSNDCTEAKGSLNTICGYIDIDTNGTKGPNMFGKDHLCFRVIRENELYIIAPTGSKDDGYTCVSPGTGWPDSLGCTSYYILNKELP